MKQLIQTLFLGFFVVNLTGCPGGGSDSDDTPSFTGNTKATNPGSNNAGDGGTSADPSTPNSTSNPPAVLGSLNSFNTFVDGLISSSNSGILSPNTSTTLTVVLADAQRKKVSQQATYSFVSTCLATGKAELDRNFVTNSDGTVSVNYFSRGCNGTDAVTAQATVGEQTFSAAIDLETRNTSTGSSGGSSTASLLGSFNSYNAFVDGLVKSSNTGILLTGDSTTLTAALADQSGNSISAEALYTFTSACLSSGLAEVDKNFETTSSGSISATYFARGCEGTDTVTIQATVGEKTLNATVNVEMAQPVRIGSIDSTGAFINGVIRSDNTGPLIAGDTATLSIVLVNDDNEPVTTPDDVFVSSNCLANGLAETDQKVVRNATGAIEVLYTARGCNSVDTVTANTTANGTSVSASVDLTTEQAPVGSIAFVGVDKNQIGIKGTDTLSNQATVTYQVTDASGNPVPNQSVSFALDTDTGGITLSKTSATTDVDGVVTTLVTAGSVNTPVRVIATAGSDSAESSALSITTGLAAQDSFSLRATTLNIEGWRYDGIETELTARLAARYNNPVAAGTAVNFITEGGKIVAQCLTLNGGCSAILDSSNPRPTDGRVTVLATAVGEETYADTNGNGTFNDGEAFDSLGEAFLDKNEDGAFTTGTGSQLTEDIPLDFNNNGSLDVANGTFEGVLCDEALNAECNQSNQETIHVRDEIVIVFSDSFFDIALNPKDSDGNGIFDDNDADGFPDDHEVFFLNSNSESAQFIVLIQDRNGQVPPAETTYKFEATNGEIVAGPENETQASTNSAGPIGFGFFIKPDGDGLLTAEIVTPRGNKSTGSVSISEFDISVNPQDADNNNELDDENNDGFPDDNDLVFGDPNPTPLNFDVIIQRSTERALPENTTYTISSTHGEIVGSTNGEITFTQGAVTSIPATYTIQLNPSATAGNGLLIVEVETPQGDTFTALVQITQTADVP